MKSLPALTRFYGFHPRDVDDLTYRELGEYLTQMDAYHREQEQQQRKLEPQTGRSGRAGRAAEPDEAGQHPLDWARAQQRDAGDR